MKNVTLFHAMSARMFPVLLLCFVLGNASATTYTFSIAGIWNDAANWAGNLYPPEPLPAADFIVINADCTRGSNLTMNGTLTINAGKTLEIYRSYDGENYTFTNGGTVNNYGTIKVTTFNFINNAGRTITNFSGSTLIVQTLGTLTNNGTFLNSSGSTVTVLTAGAVNNENGSTFTNNGTFTSGWFLTNKSGATFNNNASLSTASSGGIDNNSGGILNLNSGSTINVYCTFNNLGTININAGGVLNNYATTTITSTGQINIYGTFGNFYRLVNNGVISPFAGSTFNGYGLLKGSGSCQGTQLYTNAGTVSPGASPGCYGFTSGFTNNGTIHMELNGLSACTQFDQIQVTGTMTKGATLELVFGFTPTVGQTFQIFTASAFAGNFSFTDVTPSNIQVSLVGGLLTVTAVLPIELLDFKAIAKENKAEVIWQTAAERNVQNFEIEKSTDGQKFETIATVRANNAPSVYSTMDEQFSASAYYRLKTNDLDGKVDYSKIVFLEKSNNDPNQIKSDAQGNIWLETEAKVEWVQVVNSIGQIVKTTTEKQFSIADLPMGIYVVSVKTSSGVFSKQVLR